MLVVLLRFLEGHGYYVYNNSMSSKLQHSTKPAQHSFFGLSSPTILIYAHYNNYYYYEDSIRLFSS